MSAEIRPERPLPEVQSALALRYPCVRVEAHLFRHADGEYSQVLSFNAPRERLAELGLAPPASRIRECIDQWGTKICSGPMHATHFHRQDQGATEGRLPAQHWDNERTRYKVGRILKRLREKARG